MIINPDVNHILNIFKENNHRAYIVGGCVRDSLIGKEPHDWDICTSAIPQDIIKVAHDNNIKYIPSGIKHGTITLLVNGNGYEVTTFRVDGDYSDGRHPDKVEFTSDIIKDLARRDFTINAMAFDIKSGIIDPFDGQSDLANGLVRCVRNPFERFTEDGLRIMRALRFASTFNFEIEETTSKAIHNLKSLLNGISSERIQSELLKFLAGDGVYKLLLEYSDVITEIIPELKPSIGLNQHNKHHIYTVYEHIAKAVGEYTGDDEIINMALLLHDIGKPDSFQLTDGVGHFYGHAKISSEKSINILNRLRFSNSDTDGIFSLVRYHDMEYIPTNNCVRRWLSKLGEQQLRRLLIVIRSDVMAQSDYMRNEKLTNLGLYESKLNELVQKEGRLKLTDLNISGRDVMMLGAEQGPLVGKILNRLFEMVLDGEIKNDNRSLLTKAARLLNEYKKTGCD